MGTLERKWVEPCSDQLPDMSTCFMFEFSCEHPQIATLEIQLRVAYVRCE